MHTFLLNCTKFQQSKYPFKIWLQILIQFFVVNEKPHTERKNRNEMFTKKTFAFI